MRGTLFDQEKVIAESGPVLDQMGVRERVELAAGSFFDSDAIPGPAYSPQAQPSTPIPKP
jgi:hypothetical protein